MSPSPKTIRVLQHIVVISGVKMSSELIRLSNLSPSVPNLLLGSVLMPCRTIMSVIQLDFSVEALISVHTSTFPCNFVYIIDSTNQQRMYMFQVCYIGG
jgi:hypothetical protein